MQEMHGLTVDLAIDPLLDPKQEDYTVLLFQSVRELLFNVVKHAGVTSARVEMRKDEDGCHRIIVSDQGSGLDSKIIWENADTGTGFGLFSIRERMVLMGGRLEVESISGKGSSFSLVLPQEKITPVEVKPPEISAGLKKPLAGQPSLSNVEDKIRVMLVDDHEVVRNGLSTLLGNNPDMEVVGESSDGEEAVRKAREILPDVILMDINMPKMNGLEATRRIHAEFPHIRIIILSMYEDHEDASAALYAGASVFLTKSGSADKLLAAVRNKVE
jgi:CheY-like chemotaxis protein